MTHQTPHAVQPDLFPDLLPDDEEIAFGCWIDGLIAGVAVGPKGVAMSEWMPLVWGTVDDAPAKQELRTLVETALSDLWCEIADAMRNGEYYAPRFHHVSDELAGAKIWGDGFRAAMSLRPAAWKQLAVDREHNGSLASIMLLSVDEAELLKVMQSQMPAQLLDAAEFRQDHLDNVAEAMHDIHGYFHGRHSPPAEAIGRNAPCPCGSGRKYKKCCLR